MDQNGFFSVKKIRLENISSGFKQTNKKSCKFIYKEVFAFIAIHFSRADPADLADSVL